MSALGSLADIRERIRDVRFAPESGHVQRQDRCLLCACRATSVTAELHAYLAADAFNKRGVFSETWLLSKNGSPEHKQRISVLALAYRATWSRVRRSRSRETKPRCYTKP
jgi:hypothetical protein